jgi:hypothetical protein
LGILGYADAAPSLPNDKNITISLEVNGLLSEIVLDQGITRPNLATHLNGKLLWAGLSNQLWAGFVPGSDMARVGIWATGGVTSFSISFSGDAANAAALGMRVSETIHRFDLNVGEPPAAVCGLYP